MGICKKKRRGRQLAKYSISFDIHDRKGLEIVMLSALLSFSDYSEANRSKREREESIPPTPAPGPSAKALGKMAAVPPELPPKPENIKTGVERVAELQRGNLSEVSIFDEEDAVDYAQYCANRLEVCAPSRFYGSSHFFMFPFTNDCITTSGRQHAFRHPSLLFTRHRSESLTSRTPNETDPA